MAVGAWRVAYSLAKLKDQVNAGYPNRSKGSDGFVGDTAHAATVSDHNPNSAGVVTAFDITHDPANGLDIAVLAQALADSRDVRIKYLIRNSQILIPANGWSWTAYSGDPHTNHLHISVNVNNYDNDQDWSIGGQDMTALCDSTILTKLWVGYAIQYPAPDSYLQYWDGKPVTDVLDWLEVQPIHVELIRKASTHDGLVNQISKLEDQSNFVKVSDLYIKK